MMYSATLLASLLASAHGFAATPTGGEPSPPPSPPELECSANEEKFFVYSVDPSMVYPFVASFNASLAPPSETKDLIGNTWQGLQLSITQGNTTITQAGGKPLTVTSPNTLESGGFNVVSEDFCLGYGNWTVRMGAPTHPEMASYNASAGNLTMEERRAIGAPINAVPVTQAVGNWALKTINIDVNNFNGQVYTPFTIRWAIFPAEMRADAEAAAATGAFGMLFIEDNVSPAWAVYQVDYEEGKVVPGPVYLARPSRSQAAPQQQWFGTAPACSTDKTDCTSRGMTVVRYDKSGGGKSCSGGKKVLCEFPTPGGYMWIGVAPECNGVIADCAANNMAFVLKHSAGGGKSCLTGTKACRVTRASLPTSANATYKGWSTVPESVVR